MRWRRPDAGIASADYGIVGGGINSPVAAAILGNRGRKVVLLERSDLVGGCLRTEEITAPGFVHDALEEQRFIVRKARPEDLRVRYVEIAQAGRDAFSRVWPMMYDLLLKLFEGVDNEEYTPFTATLHKVIANIRKHRI